jgi:hypothetical protein
MYITNSCRVEFRNMYAAVPNYGCCREIINLRAYYSNLVYLSFYGGRAR